MKSIIFRSSVSNEPVTQLKLILGEQLSRRKSHAFSKEINVTLCCPGLHKLKPQEIEKLSSSLTSLMGEKREEIQQLLINTHTRQDLSTYARVIECARRGMFNIAFG